MDLKFEKLTHLKNSDACKIDRDDISEDFVDTASTIMNITDYGVEHHCIGHTFVVWYNEKPISLILLGEAIPWETDPLEMSKEPFYRLMGFVVDKEYRGCGIGGEILEKAIQLVYRDYGKRPIALGCHKDNIQAERFLFTAWF